MNSYLDFKYPVDKLAGAFIKMGLASDEPIEVKGVKVVPRDVLMKLVRRPGNKFFEENEESILQSDLTGIVDLCVDGEREGKKLTHKISYRSGYAASVFALARLPSSPASGIRITRVTTAITIK